MIIMCDSYVTTISSQRNGMGVSGQLERRLGIGEDSLDLQGGCLYCELVNPGLFHLLSLGLAQFTFSFSPHFRIGTWEEAAQLTGLWMALNGTMYATCLVQCSEETLIKL